MSENPPGGVTPPPNDQPVPPPVPPVPPVPPAAPPAAPVPPPAAPVPPPAAPVPPAAPPAAPGYGPPPGYTAPPPAGYTAPPPAGYGYAAPPSSTDVVMDGVKYGWKKFTENVGPFIIGGLVWFIGLGIIAGILWTVVFASLTSSVRYDAYGNVTSIGGGLGFFGMSIFIGVVMLLAVLVQAAFLNAALLVASGRPLQVGDFFKVPNFGKVFTTALLVGLAEGVGFALCYIPGLIVMFFFCFAIIFALDRGLGAVDAIKASVDLVKNNVGTVLLMLIGVWVVTAIGSALCGIGLLAAYPIAYVLTVYVYRRIQNQPVAP